MIREHNSQSPFGYNMTEGGDGVMSGRKHTTATIRKMRESHSQGQHNGEKHPSAKLIESQVLDIYNRVWSGEKGSVLAAEFGIVKSAISNIKHRKRWKHILAPKILEQLNTNVATL